MQDHVLVVMRGASNEGWAVYGPATRDEIIDHLLSIGANRAANGDYHWFDNSEPGVRYTIARLIPLPVPLTPAA